MTDEEEMRMQWVRALAAFDREEHREIYEDLADE